MDGMNGMDGIDRTEGRCRIDYMDGMDGISRMDMIEGNDCDGWFG